MADYRSTPWVNPRITTKNSGRVMDTCEVYCYPVQIQTGSMGTQVEVWATPPTAFRASVQEHSANSEQVDPAKPPQRLASVFTHNRNPARWHDKLVVNGVTWQVVSVVERQHNVTGDYNYTRIECVFLSEKNSVNKV